MSSPAEVGAARRCAGVDEPSAGLDGVDLLLLARSGLRWVARDCAFDMPFIDRDSGVEMAALLW
jgi:hypothetical protein